MHDLPSPTALERADRFNAMVRDLVPRIRKLSPELSDDQVMVAAVRMATYRLDDEEGVRIVR
jgi:hypothetical protein